MVSRKLAMRHEPDIGLRCCSTCSKITSFSDEKHEADENPLPFPMHSVCTLKTFPCVPAKRAHVFQRARDAGTHGDVLDGHTPHTTPHHTTQHNTTQHDTPHHTTTTRPQHHTETEKEDRERLRGRGEKEDRDREEKTENKRRTRQDKTERREKREERREKREDERQDERR